MSGEWLNGLPGPVGASVALPGSEPDRKRFESPTGERDESWQRELVQAQEAGFSGWFDSPVPAAITSRTTPAADSTNASGTPVSERPVAASATLSSSTVSQRATGATAQRTRDAAPLARSTHGALDAAASWNVYGNSGAMASWAAGLAIPPGGSVSSSLAAVPDEEASTVDPQVAPQTPALPAAQLNAMLAAQFLRPVQTVDEPGLAQAPASRDAPATSDSTRAVQDDSAATSASASASASSEPVRLYAEWSGEGVRIWLGVDADQLPGIAPLARQLREQLRAQGVGLQSLVCNGAAVPLDAASANPGTFTGGKTEPDSAPSTSVRHSPFSHVPVSLQANPEEL